MKEKYFKCTLITDIVLNASLATEGNMTTLDYIPGSNFLGIVAAEIYKDSKINYQQKMDLLHSNSVSFGDAIISKNDKIHYAMPFMYFKDKLNKEGEVFLHHKIDQEKGIIVNDKKLQLKQERTGFLNIEGKIIEKINKTFALKSAQNRETRTSKEGSMFGFESIKAGQEFIFSIKYTFDTEIEIIENLLIGKKRIGKSKSAEFGQIDIQHLALDTKTKMKTFQENDFTLVYSESNLCFIDENTGQSTYQPTAVQLGIDGGIIDWNKSSIRTNSYSPWNFKRNTSNMQRNCILKGSVFYVQHGVQNADNKPIGEFVAEGMGRVIYNPVFLKAKGDGVLDFTILNKDKPKDKIQITPSENCNTVLGKVLFSKFKTQKLELDIARQVVEAVKISDWDLKSNITSSQWGNIRALATNYIKNGKEFDDLYTKIGFYNEEISKVEREKIEKEGIITHGKMSEKLWDKNRKENFKKIIKNTNLVFVAKYSAEMAKVYIDIKNGKIKKAL